MISERDAAANRLLATFRELQNYYSLNERLSYFREGVANGELNFEYEVSDELRSFVERVTQFGPEFDAFESQVKKRFEEAAWDYLCVEYSFHRGDRLQRVRDGKTEIMTIENMFMDEPNVNALAAAGHVVRKRGSVGTRRAHIYFGQEDWTRIPGISVPRQT